MVTDAFGQILHELGQLLKLKDLHADSNNSCLIKFKNGLQVQIEPDRRGDCLILGCDIGVIPPGRYRENIFREALKANGFTPPKAFHFAYSRKSDKLVLMAFLLLRHINGQKVYEQLLILIKQGESWKEALTRGEVPSHLETQQQSSGIFGLGKK